jgi:uncharacterized protein (TIGR02271 family)
MTTFETSQLQGWVGHTAVDSNGDKIGKIEAIYEDDAGGGPEWFAISTGWFGTSVSFAPVAGATRDGDDLRLPWSKDDVKDAPRMDDDDGHLTPDEERRLYRHYGMEWDSDTTTTTHGKTGNGQSARGKSTGQSSGDRDAMTRSEEEIDVQKRSKEVGHARLKKWVETEDVNVTVPVRREVARLVTEPVNERNKDRAMDGPALKENEHDVVLHEEQLDVDKKVVPKERVRVETDTVEEKKNVNEQVRKEKIAMEGDDRRRN